MNHLVGSAPLDSRNGVVIDGVFFDPETILNREIVASVDTLRETFLANKPFPHLVIDNLFPVTLLELMNKEFDQIKHRDWRLYDSEDERKYGSLPGTRFGPATQLYFSTIHSSPFLSFLERLTGIEGLICDPHLTAGGLHDIPSGGRFALHLDFNQHPHTHLANRLVFITYLNRNWQSSWGGQLELWDKDADRCVEKVNPILGRTIVFAQSSNSLHGHPTPVSAPDERPRRSAAAYFYSNGRDDGESDEFHTTIISKPIRATGPAGINERIRYWIPPAFVDMIRYYKRKRHASKW